MATKRGTAGRNVGCGVTCSQNMCGQSSCARAAIKVRLSCKALARTLIDGVICSTHLLRNPRRDDWPACQDSVNKAVHEVCPDLHIKL